jgi:hypothetical protein
VQLGLAIPDLLHSEIMKDWGAMRKNLHQENNPDVMYIRDTKGKCKAR